MSITGFNHSIRECKCSHDRSNLHLQERENSETGWQEAILQGGGGQVHGPSPASCIPAGFVAINNLPTLAGIRVPVGFQNLAAATGLGDDPFSWNYLLLESRDKLQAMVTGRVASRW